MPRFATRRVFDTTRRAAAPPASWLSQLNLGRGTIAQHGRRHNLRHARLALRARRPIAARARAFLYSATISRTEIAVRSSSEQRIRDHRARGWWSDTRITDLFDAALRSAPQDQDAVVDPPNREALIGGTPRRLTFRQVADLADGYALRLRELGLGRDDVLITQLPNVVEYVAVYLAAMRLGIVLSPVPMQYRRHELAEIVALTGARATLTVKALKGIEHAAGAVQLAAELPLTVLCLGGEAPPGALPFEPAPLTEASRAALRAHVDSLGVDADDIVTICWTSGTEGLPKGVPRSHNLWIAISWAHLRGAGIQRGERLLNPFPLDQHGCAGRLLHELAAQRRHAAAAPSARPAGVPAADRRGTSAVRDRAARDPQHAAEGRGTARANRSLFAALPRLGLGAARSRR
jgi:hypothetical protein